MEMNQSLSLSKKIIFYALLIVFLFVFIEILGYAVVFYKFDKSPYQLGKESLNPEGTMYVGDHPYLPYFPKYGLMKNGMHFNSMGNRGPEPDKDKKRIRILTLGGSTTFEHPYKWKDTWAGKLQALLGSEKYEVINAALNGSTSADSVVNFTLRQSDLNPDYVIVYHGTNDLESSFAKGFKADYSHRRRNIGLTPIPIFETLPDFLNYSSIFVKLRLMLIGHRGRLDDLYSRPKVYDWKNGPFGVDTFERNLRNIYLIANENGAKVIYGTFAYYKKWLHNRLGSDFANGWEKGLHLQNERIKRLSTKYENAYIVDIANNIEPSDQYFSDFCHFTHDGNDVMAEMFYQKIKSLEESRNPASGK